MEKEIFQENVSAFGEIPDHDDHVRQPKINFSQALTSKPAFIRWSVYGIIALVILNLGILGGKGFIYAQF